MVKISIEEIEIYHLTMKLRTLFRTSFGEESMRHPIIIIMKSGDYMGFGEAPGDHAPLYSYEYYRTILLVLKEFLIPQILSKNFSSPQEFRNALQIVRGHNFAKAALEYAFWDLYAKILGKPLYELYGGVKKEIPVGVSIGIFSSLRELLDQIDYFLERGYQRIKIKIKPGYDVQVVQAIREHFGEIPLQVDANAAYDLSRHMDNLIELDRFSLLMIEQPLSYDDLVDHQYLRSLLKTPICLDESVTSYNQARAAIKIGSMDILNIKPPRVGGVLETLRIHELLLAQKVGMWIGGLLETGIGKVHLLHLASLPGINYPSDISESSRYWERDIIQPLKLQKNGTIRIPTGKGIGIQPDFELIEKFAKHHWIFKSGGS